MQYKHNKELVPFAKELRKKMTKEERHYGTIFCAAILSAFCGKR